MAVCCEGSSKDVVRGAGPTAESINIERDSKTTGAGSRLLFSSFGCHQRPRTPRVRCILFRQQRAINQTKVQYYTLVKQDKKTGRPYKSCCSLHNWPSSIRGRIGLLSLQLKDNSPSCAQSQVLLVIIRLVKRAGQLTFSPFRVVVSSRFEFRASHDTAS